MPSTALSPAGRRLVTTFGLGLMRPASGTWGSLPSVVLAGVLIACGWRPSGAGALASAGYHAVMLGVLAVFTLACIVYGDAAEAAFGKKDPGQIVADETAGQCLPLLALPAAATLGLPHALGTLALAFVAFRAFDVLKLWPARGLQRVPGGWGVVLDDLVAGVQAAVVVQAVARVW
jgi:phosphatidylglycerophosphatase A